MNITSSEKTILASRLLFFWSNVIFSGLIFPFFCSKLPAVKLLLPGLVREDYYISLLISWINKFDLIKEPKVLKIAGRSPGRQYLLHGNG